ncbi:MAG: hypothetical protein HC920_09115, partial [Oscillatoriales cyanobacterium SM2_3_0]|nr:hypothetical protein [Oscillatoriales cyanobacterium SM2_3_0]
SIPAWDKTWPATLSPEILTHQLRQTLGFQGLIVTDALVMGRSPTITPLKKQLFWRLKRGQIFC